MNILVFGIFGIIPVLVNAVPSSKYKDKCVLPPFPKHGNYSVTEGPEDAAPGQALDAALLLYACDTGYQFNGKSAYVRCTKGSWTINEPAKCIAQCKLKKNPSVIYRCLAKYQTLAVDAQECGDLVAEGVTVRPECREPNYHYPGGVIPFVKCVDGVWNRRVPTCTAQCGYTANNDVDTNGTADRGRLPWHAGIYNKQKKNEQICGGSLVSNSLVITAAHCFWSWNEEKMLPAKDYAVALGKLYRPWDDPQDLDAQKSDVKDILVPPKFEGSMTSFQSDIALVVLATPVEYRQYVSPVCLDFDVNFERSQLGVGNMGKVAGWELTEDGKASPALKVAELPFVDINQCYAESPAAFYLSITSDKFCAGNYNGSALCKGDSGGGLVFGSYERGEDRYYLRGVVATAVQQNNFACNTYKHTTHTLISKHQAFIQEHWK